MTRRAIYAGSFDPLTLGHADLIQRGLALFDVVVVAVAPNIRKQPLFEVMERVAMIREVFPDSARVVIASLDGLLIDAARAQGCQAILRGLRSVTDFEYELPMATMNRCLAPQIETVFLMTSPELAAVSSSLIKEVARFGGDISAFVPDPIGQRLRDKYPPQV